MSKIRDHPYYSFLNNALYTNDIPHEKLLFIIENTENTDVIVALIKRINDINMALKRKYDQLLIDQTLELGISAFISKELNEIELMDRFRINPTFNEIIRMGTDYYIFSANEKKRELVKAFFYDYETGFVAPQVSPLPIRISNLIKTL